MAKAPAKAGRKPRKPRKRARRRSFKKKEKRVVHNGIVHVQATFNNTIVTIADPEGNTISWSSAGSLGFRGSRKGTPFAAQQASMTAASKAKEVGLRDRRCARQRPGIGPRIGDSRAGHIGSRSTRHQGQHADSAQRMPAAEKAKSVETVGRMLDELEFKQDRRSSLGS